MRSLYTIVTIPSHALGSAVNTMVSNTIGAGRQNEVLNLIKRVTLISLFSMLAIILIVAVVPRLMIHIYTNDTSLIDDTVAPLYVLLTSLPFYAIGTVLFSAVSGTGNTQRALLYEIITLLGYVFYTWIIVVYLRLSVSWAWTTEDVYKRQVHRNQVIGEVERFFLLPFVVVDHCCNIPEIIRVSLLVERSIKTGHVVVQFPVFKEPFQRIFVDQKQVVGRR